MFEFLFREKVFETTDSQKKFEVGCKLKENHIECRRSGKCRTIKKKTILHKEWISRMWF